MITFQQFIIDFPEFASANQGQFATFLNIAAMMLPQDRWGLPADAGQPISQYDYACELIVAHNYALSRNRQLSAAAGGAPGLSRGVISSESAGPASVNYDSKASQIEGAGQWNLTEYGQTFFQMLELVGAAPITVSPSGPCGSYNGSPWVGPTPVPGFFG